MNLRDESPEPNERFLTVLRAHLTELDDREPIPLDQPLLELGLDSLGAVDLLLDLEQTFSVVFPDELLTRETFRDTRALGRALAQVLRQPGET
jgi:acyl carrier protein